jgi:hypothetical protein
MSAGPPVSLPIVCQQFPFQSAYVSADSSVSLPIMCLHINLSLIAYKFQ